MNDRLDLENAAGMLEMVGDYLTANMVLVDMLSNKIQNFDQLCNETSEVFEQARQDAQNLRNAIETTLEE